MTGGKVYRKKHVWNILHKLAHTCKELLNMVWNLEPEENMMQILCIVCVMTFLEYEYSPTIKLLKNFNGLLKQPVVLNISGKAYSPHKIIMKVIGL